MRYITELSDGSRYISSSLTEKVLVIMRLFNENRCRLITHEFQWDTRKPISEARSQGRKNLIPYSDVSKIELIVLLNSSAYKPQYRQKAEKRAEIASKSGRNYFINPYNERGI